MDLLTPQESRARDRATIDTIGIPGFTLMERASLGAVNALLSHFGPNPGPIGILCGPGNNGGDGVAMARHLHQRGHDVLTILLHPEHRYSGDVALNLTIARRSGVAILDLGDIDDAEVLPYLEGLPPRSLWCDALFGTGLSRPLEGRWADAIDFLASQPRRLAVDLPSGVDAMTGQILGGSAAAELTVTFDAAKRGHALFPARALCGEVEVVDIGVPSTVRAQVPASARWLNPASIHLPPRLPTAHKGSVGRVLLVGGAATMSGAIQLAAHAALRSGAGLARVATTPKHAQLLPIALPEVMTTGLLHDEARDEEWGDAARWADVLAIGPGLGRDATARRVWNSLRDHPRLVVDADALHLLADAPGTFDSSTCVLTPHPGEAARLLQCPIDAILADSVECALELARRFSATVALKTAATVVACPEGRIGINATGNPGMATGGMGDTLTGIVSALLAQEPDPFHATSMAVCIHGRAGDLARDRCGALGLTPTGLLGQLGEVWKELEPR